MTLLQAAFFQFGFAKDDDKANKNSEGRFRRVMSNCMESDRDHQPFGYLQKKVAYALLSAIAATCMRVSTWIIFLIATYLIAAFARADCA